MFGKQTCHTSLSYLSCIPLSNTFYVQLAEHDSMLMFVLPGTGENGEMQATALFLISLTLSRAKMA